MTASLFISIAPSTACSASALWGGIRFIAASISIKTDSPYASSFTTTFSSAVTSGCSLTVTLCVPSDLIVSLRLDLFLIYIQSHLLFDSCRNLFAGDRAESSSAFSYLDRQLNLALPLIPQPDSLAEAKLLLSEFLLIVFLKFQIVQILSCRFNPHFFRQE